MPSILRLLLGLCALVLLFGATYAQDPPSVHTAARAAVANGRTDKSKLRGFSIASNHFDETNVKGGILIGFDLGLSPWFDSEVITALRPIYRTESGLSYGRAYGKFTATETRKRKTSEKPLRVVELRARPGYAVGGMKIRTGLGLDALSLFYHKITGETIEPTPSLRSDYVGNVKGGSERELTGKGQLVVGVYGNLNDDATKVIALGLIFTQPATAPAPAPVSAPQPIARPIVVAKPKPAAPRPVEPPMPQEPDPVEEPEPAPVAKAKAKQEEPPPAVVEPVAETSAWMRWLPLAVFGGVLGVFFLPLMLMLGRKKSPPIKEPVRVGPVAELKPLANVPASAQTGVTTECRPASVTWANGDEAPTSFNAMQHFVCKPNRLFRFYLLPDEMLIVYAGPGNEWEAAGRSVVGGGLIPALIGMLISGVARRKTEAYRAALHAASREDLETLIHQGQGYHLRTADLQSVRIEAPSWWDRIDHRMGRLHFRHRGLGELLYHFPSIQEMQQAIEELRDVLGERLVVNVVFDRVQGHYVRKF